MSALISKDATVVLTTSMPSAARRRAGAQQVRLQPRLEKADLLVAGAALPQLHGGHARVQGSCPHRLQHCEHRAVHQLGLHCPGAVAVGRRQLCMPSNCPYVDGRTSWINL